MQSEHENRPGPIVLTGGAVAPEFTESMMLRLAGYGEEIQIISGQRLFVRGTRTVDLFVVVEGELELFDCNGHHRTVVAKLSARQFTGELDLISNRETLLECQAIAGGKVLRIYRSSLQRLMKAEPDIAELIIWACIGRRSGLVEQSVGGVIIIGRKTCGPSMTIQRFLLRNEYPHRLLDLDTDCEARGLFDCLSLTTDDLPTVVLPGHRVLGAPTILALADALGLTEPLDRAEVCDVAIVGAGPAGLAAAVYAASEGLATILIEGNSPGGQAGTSSKIENYLGFPTGISGQELANRAQVQAQKFGARLVVSRQVTAMECLEQRCRLLLEGGRSVTARSVIVATGARYRKLDVPKYEFFETQGIHYAATPMEAAICVDQEVVVVGGGNSAGQAAIFLSQSASHVHLLVRADGLESSMSDYLIHRIASSPKITLHTRSEIVRLDGDSILREVTWSTGVGDVTETRQAGNVFVMIGASPNTEWLRGVLMLDQKGFVETGIPGGFPSIYATTLPGVFAVGDVRARSVKRVASAVGEGSVVISDVHRYFAELNMGMHTSVPVARPLSHSATVIPTTA
jgi:thioredoxin reductase (NADPH)